MAVATAELAGLAAEHVRVQRRALFLAQHVRVAKDARLRTVADRGRLTRLSLEDRWEAAFQQLSDEWMRRADIDAAVRASEWEPPPDEPEDLHSGELLPGIEKSLTGPRPSDLDAVEKWGGMRGIYGMNALMQEGKPGFDVVVLRDAAGEPRAVAAYVKDAGEMHVNLLAAREGGGNGTAMMRELAGRASREGLGMNLVASSQESADWYSKLGMSRWEVDEFDGPKPRADGHRFKFTSPQARQFAQTGGWTAPNVAEAQAAMMQALNAASWAVDGAQVYLALAQGTSVAAGQWSLDAMGLNRTFAWAHPRSMARDLFAVRGSKVVQQLHGEHLNRLSQIIQRATAPGSPLTVPQVKKLVMDEWPKLKKWQALRIARTETAAVWSATSANAYMANGVTQVESLVAHGPSIDVDVNGACDICVEAAASGPMDIMGDLPPWHPNCRCDIIPVLQDPETGEEWLPPDEPWTGGAELPACGTPGALAGLAKRRRLEKWRSVRVVKAKTNCAIPAPEPGEAFGGDLYKTYQGMEAAHLEGWRAAIELWPDEGARTAALALLHVNAGGDFKAVFAAGSGDLKGIAAFERMHGTKEFFVKGVATKGGGGMRLLTSIARDAYALDWNMAVWSKYTSPAVMKRLEGIGFKGDSPERIKLKGADLKDAFKWSDEPPAAPAAQATQAPQPDSDSAAEHALAMKGATDEQLLEWWESTLTSPGTRAAAEAEMLSRGYTPQRMRERLRSVVSEPGTHLPDEHVFSPGGWQKADGTKFIDQHLTGEGYGSRLKGTAMSRIAAELKKDPKWNADEVSSAYGYSATVYGAQGDEAVVSQLINNWARTSSDADSRALAIQVAAKEEFGLDVEVFPAHFAGGRDSARARQLIDQTMELLNKPGVRDSLRAFLRAQYNVTQRALADGGVTHVTLYRGIKAQTDEGWMGRPGFGEVAVTDNPLASWSVRWGQSKKFAGHYGHGSRSIMLRAEVPRELVMGFPGYGFGCSHEFEVVLLNHGRNTAWALVSGTRQLDDVERAAAREAYEDAQAKLTAVGEEMAEAEAAWRAAGSPWSTDHPAAKAKTKIYKKWVKLQDEVGSLQAAAHLGKITEHLVNETDFVKRIKALAPDRPAKGPGKPRPSAGTQEDIRLLGKRIASMRHKMKYPEKYKKPGGWSQSELEDMQAKIDAMEDERRLLKEGGGTASVNIGDETAETGTGGKLAQVGPDEWKLEVQGDTWAITKDPEAGGWKAVKDEYEAYGDSPQAVADSVMEVAYEDELIQAEVDALAEVKIHVIDEGLFKETVQLLDEAGLVVGAVKSWSHAKNKWLVTLDNGDQVLVTASKSDALAVAGQKLDVEVPGATPDLDLATAGKTSTFVITAADEEGYFLSPAWTTKKTDAAKDIDEADWGKAEAETAAKALLDPEGAAEVLLYHNGMGDLMGIARLSYPEGGVVRYEMETAGGGIDEILHAALRSKVEAGGHKLELAVKVSAAELKQQIHLAGKRIATWKYQLKSLKPGDPKFEKLVDRIGAEEVEREKLRGQLKAAVKKSAYLTKLWRVRKSVGLVD